MSKTLHTHTNVDETITLENKSDSYHTVEQCNTKVNEVEDKHIAQIDNRNLSGI